MSKKINAIKRPVIAEDFVKIIAKHQGWEINSENIFESQNPRIQSLVVLSEKLIDAVEQVL